MSTINDLKDQIISGELLEQSVYAAAGSITEDDIARVFGNDPWLHNRVLNIWEFYHGREALKSYPVDVSIPLVVGCNIKCVFCSYWRTKLKFMELDKVNDYNELMKYTAYAGINPAGEPFLHPQIGEALRRMRQMTDPRCQIYVVTNGLSLAGKMDDIIDNVSTITFSMNAATPETFSKVMGARPGGFERLLESITELKRRCEQTGSSLRIFATYCVMKNNIAEIPSFVRLAEESGLEKVWFRNLATANSNNAILQDLNEGYKELPPYLHSDFDRLREEAVEAIFSSDLDLYAEPEQWGKDVFLPDSPVEGVAAGHKEICQEVSTCGERTMGEDARGWVTPPKGKLPLICNYPFRTLMDSKASNIQSVCSFIEKLPGYNEIALDLKNRDFHKDIWNAEAYQALRRSLIRGPKITDVCMQCNFLCSFSRIYRKLEN